MSLLAAVRILSPWPFSFGSGGGFELVFADTGAELPEVYWLLPRLAKTIGKTLHVVSNGSFFQHLAAYGYMLPGPRLRWCTRLLKQVPLPNFLEAPVLGHSEKPEEFRKLIEVATSRTIETPRRIELFARRRVPGWDAWGNEVESDIAI